MWHAVHINIFSEEETKNYAAIADALNYLGTVQIRNMAVCCFFVDKNSITLSKGKVVHLQKFKIDKKGEITIEMENIQKHNPFLAGEGAG